MWTDLLYVLAVLGAALVGIVLGVLGVIWGQYGWRRYHHWRKRKQTQRIRFP